MLTVDELLTELETKYDELREEYVKASDIMGKSSYITEIRVDEEEERIRLVIDVRGEEDGYTIKGMEEELNVLLSNGGIVDYYEVDIEVRDGEIVSVEEINSYELNSIELLYD